MRRASLPIPPALFFCSPVSTIYIVCLHVRVRDLDKEKDAHECFHGNHDVAGWAGASGGGGCGARSGRLFVSVSVC